MKQYLLFAGFSYYPSGGWNDFIDSFDTNEEALTYKKENDNYDWYHVIDTVTGERTGSSVYNQ